MSNDQDTGTPVMRSDIEERFRNSLNLTKYGANTMARAIIDVMCRNLIEGKTIELRGVGKVESRVKAARMHHVLHESKGNRMRMVPARRVLRFSPSRLLRARMTENYETNLTTGNQRKTAGI